MTSHKTAPIRDYIKLLREEGLLLEGKNLEGQEDRLISNISYDSNKVFPGTLFVCKGSHFLPQYLSQAAAKGASCFVSEEYYKEGEELPFIKVRDVRKTLACLANFYYENIWEKLILTGITGTKGKSSTTYYLKTILDDYMKESGGKETGLLSGIDNYDGVISEESHLTTPETFELHQHFLNAYLSDLKYMTMEVSSQALKYHRTLGINFDVAVFLNIGTDHISEIEHRDFEDYLSSKLVLMSQCKKAVINHHSSHKNELLKAAAGAEEIILFGRDPECQIYAYDFIHLNRGTEFKVRTPSWEANIELTKKGDFYIENALAAIGAAHALNIPIESIRRGLKEAIIPGRMEIFEDKIKDLLVFVDYAHNKMSFEALFSSIRKEYQGRHIGIVFGCPGKKALDRRRELGEIAGRNADVSYITEEDYGEEDLKKISNEIAGSIEGVGGTYEIIDDREEAIKKAIKDAPAHSIVLITGKGRETRQKRGNLYIETPSDVEIVERVLGNEG